MVSLACPPITTCPEFSWSAPHPRRVLTADCRASSVKHGIATPIGVGFTAIDRDAFRVHPTTDQEIAYDYLVWALLPSRAYPASGSTSDGLLEMRTRGDAERLRNELTPVVGVGERGRSASRRSGCGCRQAPRREGCGPLPWVFCAPRNVVEYFLITSSAQWRQPSRINLPDLVGTRGGTARTRTLQGLKRDAGELRPQDGTLLTRANVTDICYTI
jgi:hypothetical protein